MRIFLFVLMLAIGSPAAFAHCHEDGKKAGKMGEKKEPTKEEREQMSTMHAKMAECLKSDKSMQDCHKEMAESCPMAKDGQCPMMAMHPHHPPKGPKSKMPKGKKE